MFKVGGGLSVYLKRIQTNRFWFEESCEISRAEPSAQRSECGKAQKMHVKVSFVLPMWVCSRSKYQMQPAISGSRPETEACGSKDERELDT